ncbi:MAG TPA: hypothetical protein DCL31_19135, partial [Clostridium sp.]|nr:hypothetical protein [Clostridium sp.]
SIILETTKSRQKIGDTDIGKELITQINDLEKLLMAYRKGLIKELK